MKIALTGKEVNEAVVQWLARQGLQLQSAQTDGLVLEDDDEVLLEASIVPHADESACT